MKLKAVSKKLNYHSTKVYLVLFVLIFIFQLVKVLIFNDFNLYQIKADGKAYIGLSENLFSKGVYEFNGSYTSRMPGITILYLPIRYFFLQHITLQFLSVFMLLFYSFSVIYFSKQLCAFFNKGIVFFILLVSILGLTDYITYWGFPFYTESLACSCLLIGFAFLLKAEKKRKNVYYFLSGAFICWLIFLRPFMIVIWILMALYIVYKFRNEIRSRLMLSLFLFTSMFIIVDSIWIIRNYSIENKFTPLQAYPDFSNHLLSYREFLKSFGGDAVEWNPNSEGLWFQNQKHLKDGGFERPSDDIFPERIFNKSFTLDSLKNLRQIYWDANNDSLILNERQFKSDLFIEKVKDFIDNYKKESPFDFYIGSRLTLLRKFIFQPFTYYLNMRNDSPVQFLIKGLIYIINAFVIIIGFFSLILFTTNSLIKRKFKAKDGLLIMVPLFLIALFPVYYGFVEYRFLVLGFPFLAYFSILLLRELSRQKN
ncbi:glycosyltransferase family protein [Brumimicrobium aurantiacum]|nr:hypothetical protein [Brumimicrobium aurantiacum]